MPSEDPASDKGSKDVLRSGLTLAALGVVFGDIGTSPLYALNAACAFASKADLRESILGIVSLFFWTLVMVVTFKYILFIMRADNDGEGGIFSLHALLQDHFSDEKKIPYLFLIIAFGAALLVGDAVITPSISVLSAMEGLEVVSNTFHPYIGFLALGILVIFFLFQRLGTGKIGAAFGPVMLIWFLVIGCLGLWKLIEHGPAILQAMNPYYAFHFLAHEKATSLGVLGAVVLCVTGAEALYADMGHFGRTAIAKAWLFIAFPALLLNYFGQGALVLSLDQIPKNLFFNMVPNGVWTYLLIGLSTLATIIASQAVVSGVFSLTRQAIQLRYWPNIAIVHTSLKVAGQIYIPMVNIFLAIACVLTVLIFKSSENLAAAYGIAVTGTMAITSLAYFYVRVRHWKKSLFFSLILLGIFLIIDLTFLTSNLLKIGSGGIYPLVIAGFIFSLMITWRIGRWYIDKSIYSRRRQLTEFLEDEPKKTLKTVSGTAVFITRHYLTAPSTLEDLAGFYGTIREHNIILTPIPDNRPQVGMNGVSEIDRVDKHFMRATFRFGYRERPDLMNITRIILERSEIGAPLDNVVFHFSRERIYAMTTTKMPRILKLVFVILSRNSQPAQELMLYPPNRTMEVVVPVYL